MSVCVRVSVLPDGGRKERHVWEGHGASGGMTGAWLYAQQLANSAFEGAA